MLRLNSITLPFLFYSEYLQTTTTTTKKKKHQDFKKSSTIHVFIIFHPSKLYPMNRVIFFQTLLKPLRVWPIQSTRRLAATGFDVILMHILRYVHKICPWSTIIHSFNVIVKHMLIWDLQIVPCEQPAQAIQSQSKRKKLHNNYGFCSCWQQLEDFSFKFHILLCSKDPTSEILSQAQSSGIQHLWNLLLLEKAGKGKLSC